MRKKFSIVQYLTLVIILILLVGGGFILGIQNAIVEKDIEISAKNILYNEMRRVRDYLEYDEASGTIQIQDAFYNDTEEEGQNLVFTLIVDEAGNPTAGIWPGEYEKETDEYSRQICLVSFGGEDYYVQGAPAILRDSQEDSRKSKILVAIRYQDVKDQYKEFRYLSYLAIACLLGIFLLFAISFQHYIIRPMMQMRRFVEKMEDKLNLSKRLEYQGPFVELEMLTEANNRLYDTIETEFHRQERFNADISHELRTPIAVMNAQCQLSRELGQKTHNTDLLDCVSVFERQTERMQNMMLQLLQLSAVEQNKEKLRLEEFDLYEVLDSICDDQEYVCDKNITFARNYSSIMVKADMDLLMSAIGNLISNAVKYSEPGSCVDITNGKEEGFCFVRVRDRGHGMDEEQLHKIFECYYRGDAARNSEGFGLGLTIALRIAKCHGGDIKVASEPGKGSIFTLLLPDRLMA